MSQKTKQKPKRKRTAAEIVAYQQGHSQDQVDTLARQANDLPSLIAWAHRAEDFGLWLTRTTARRWKANRPPLDVPGLDMRGEVWPWLVGEVHRLCGIGRDELWIFAVCYLLGKVHFDGHPDPEQRYKATLKVLRDHERDDPGSVALLRAELRQRFPVAAVHIPHEQLVVESLEPDSPPRQPAGAVSHADDFGWVRLGDKEFTFAGQARKIVNLLFEVARDGDGGLQVTRIGNKVDSGADRFRLEAAFRLGRSGKVHPGYGALIEKMEGARARIRPEVARIWRAE